MSLKLVNSAFSSHILAAGVKVHSFSALVLPLGRAAKEENQCNIEDYWAGKIVLIRHGANDPQVRHFLGPPCHIPIASFTEYVG